MDRWLAPFGPLILGFLRWRRVRSDSALMIAEIETHLRGKA